MDRSQFRAARALLGWTQSELSAASGVSMPTIKRLEPGEGAAPLNAATAKKIEKTYADAGVVFIPPGAISRHAGAGVRFREMPDGTWPEAEVNVSGIIQSAILKKQEKLLALIQERGKEDDEIAELIAEIRSLIRSPSNA